MLVCPTSLLPICPSGRPTARPLADSCDTGNRAASLSRLGVPCSAMAFPSRLAELPQPSRMTSSTGRMSPFASVNGALMQDASFVVGPAAQDLERPVELLERDHAGQAVRQRQPRQAP